MPIKYRTRRLLLCFSLVALAIGIAFYLLYLCLQVIHSKSATQALYGLPFEEYIKNIPGLAYDPLKIQHAHDSKSLDKMEYFKLGDLLERWNPDDVSAIKWAQSPAHPNKGKGIPRYDYSNKHERKLALDRRNLELPFIVYNVEELDTATAAWTYSYLDANFGESLRNVEHSKDNHFLYFAQKKGKALPDGWTPPQEVGQMTFRDFAKKAIVQKNKKCDIRSSDASSNSFLRYLYDCGSEDLYYFIINAMEGAHETFIREDLPFFDKSNDFFVVDASKQKGINCRFGMKGVVAEAHYDGGRNMVAMIQGRKRYILLPPSTCSVLSLLPLGHPSARHSTIDWSDMDEVRKNPAFMDASATEVVLTRGEILYIPSYWFHYIVSQDESIQCNTRSGSGEEGYDEIAKCGFGRDKDTIDKGEVARRKKVTLEKLHIPDENLHGISKKERLRHKISEINKNKIKQYDNHAREEHGSDLGANARMHMKFSASKSHEVEDVFS